MMLRNFRKKSKQLPCYGKRTGMEVGNESNFYGDAGICSACVKGIN